MFGQLRGLVVLLGCVLMVSACNKVHTTTQLQESRMVDMKWKANAHHDNMVDNAVLHDMSLADIHFVPHSSELSGTGVARLDRMAVLLDTYGGTVRYSTNITDEQMIHSRMEHVREYLTMTGCNMSRVEIKPMMAGGRGMDAQTALIKYQQSRTSTPSGGSGGATPTSGVGSASGGLTAPGQGGGGQ